MRVETGRLILRDFRPGDVDAVHAYQSDPRYLRYYEWTERPRRDVEAFVAMLVRWSAESPRLRYQLAITRRGEEAVIGCVGVRREASSSAGAEFGCELSPDHWGAGYALEASRAVLDLAFTRLGVAVVEARCVAANAAAVRLAERLGMRRARALPGYVTLAGRPADGWLYVLERPPECGSAAAPKEA